MGAAAVPIALIATAAATGYSVYQQNEAANQAKRESRRAQAEATRAALAQQKERQEFEKEIQKENQAFVEEQRAEEAGLRDEATALENRNSARARQRARAKGAFGRSDTILTGPLGLPEDASTQAKRTILGG